MKKSVGIVFLAACTATAGAETLAEKLLAQFDPVQSVACEIRRDVEGPGGSMRMLSRVYYRKPDLLHVDQPAPIPRRIVSDGATFYSYVEGDPRGFSRPVEKLSEEMLVNLRKVPGTPMEHLMKLRGVAEKDLDATPEFPVRTGYETEKVFVVLSLDAEGRLARIEFYATPAMAHRTAQYDYSGFRQVAGGAWVPCLHKGAFTVGGVETKETVRVDNLAVNEPIAQGLFVAGPFFEGVEFVDEFDKVYE
jgi:hypothetical protein